VNPQVVAEWAKVLNATPGSRLLLLIAGGERGSTEARALLQRGGIDGRRVEFLDRQARAEFCRYFHRVDISLDPFPYNGHTTSLDSYYMGMPVVTLAGRTMVGRAGVSQLMNLKLPELIARDPEQFVKIAVELAKDLPRLEMAKKLGCVRTIDVLTEDPAEVLAGMTGGKGPDVVLECSGSVAGTNMGLNLVRRMGQFTQVGLHGKKIEVDFERICYKEAKITGSIGSIWTAWDKALKFMASGRVELRSLVSDILPVTEWEEGFRKFEAKEGLKIILEPVD
jgi:hypothetical protein